jgi:hypothetical protein
MAKVKKGSRKAEAAPRRQKFSDDERLREAIREIAIDTLGGARRVWKDLPEDERPSYVIVQAILNELGLGTKAQRITARNEEGHGAVPPEGATGPWEHAYLETRKQSCAGKSFYVSIILDRATARARVGKLVTFTSAAEAGFIEHVCQREKCSIQKIVIGRGGMRRRKVGEELEAYLAEKGTTHHLEGRWGNMGVHRTRLVGIIDAELRGVKDMQDVRAALAKAMKVYNEETKSADYPCFGQTPDMTYIMLKHGKRQGVPWTTREAKRSGTA